MVRLLLFLMIFMALWWLYRKIRKFIAQQAQLDEENGNDEQNEAMIRCRECGTYTPRSHAVRDDDGHYFCSEEHKHDFLDK